MIVTLFPDQKQAGAWKNETYSYDGKLGADLKEEGKQVDLTLWSPSADKVSVVVYDKNDPEKVVGTVALEKGERGTWKQTLDANSGLGISNYTGYLLPLPNRASG